MSEPCDRCKSVGADRRTLWMACFYAMGELGVPFEPVKLWTVEEASLTATTRDVPWSSRRYGEDGTVTESSGVAAVTDHAASGPARPKSFFTLRVCKRCRGEWMAAVEAWFLAAPRGAARKEPS